MTSAPEIAIATTTRADWGLLSQLARELRDRGARISIIAGNMHFDPRMGETWREIEADGFSIAASIPASGSTAEIFSQTAAGAAKVFSGLKPDLLVVLGDRSEILAVAAQGLIAGIPIVHIAGGAVSEGAIDDSIRHAVTKLASLHLVETQEYGRRVERMGEAPETIVVTGAIGAAAAAQEPDMTRTELEESLGFPIPERSLLVTLHAATRDPLSPLAALDELISALRSYTDTHTIIFTHPNNDVDPAPLIDRINRFAAERPDRIKVIPSLGRRRYLAALRCVEAVVGNSSSGLVEVPSAGIPTLNIGCRQQGRTAGPSVVHCGNSASEISAALTRVLSPEHRKLAASAVNPYYQPDTLGIMADAILAMPRTPFPIKHFYDAE